MVQKNNYVTSCFEKHTRKDGSEYIIEREPRMYSRSSRCRGETKPRYKNIDRTSIRRLSIEEAESFVDTDMLETARRYKLKELIYS